MEQGVTFSILLWEIAIIIIPMLGWMLAMQNQIFKKITSEDLDKKLNAKFDKVTESLDRINDAIIGTVDNKGLARRVEKLEEDHAKEHGAD